jgi:lactoylglutathione lyase
MAANQNVWQGFRMNFTLAHCNLNVFELARSIDFYRQALGLQVVRRHEASDGSFELVFLSDAESRFFLELTWLRGHAPYELGDNESHICFQTDDPAAAHTLHAAMNVICYENKGMGLYFIADPDGYWLEITARK